MAVETMAKPLEKLKKIRSWDEIRTRGGQAFSVYREQKRIPQMPTDQELIELIDAAKFGSAPVISETLWQKFFKNGETGFFPAFADLEQTSAAFRSTFSDSADSFIEAAEEILEGRIDLLGFKNLYVGPQIDWHREPLSSKRSPLKHWKEFDDLETGETGNKKVIWELNRHQHFFTLGVAFVMTGDERFGAAFAGQLESWMEQNPPAMGVNWSSSLEVSFRAMSWIWAFHLFRESDSFTPDLFKKALKNLYLHGRHLEQYLSKYYSPNTHLTGEALGLYYLGTQLPFFKRAKFWRKLGSDILFDEVMKQIHADGVYFEQSTWYQRYTADIYSQFSILRSLDPEAGFDLRGQEYEERLELAFEHMMHMTMPDGTMPLIGDDDGGRMLPLTHDAPDDFRGTLGVGSVLFDRADQKQVAGRAGEEIFWLMGAAGVAAFDAHAADEPVIASKGFPDGGYFVMRDGWDDTDNMLVVDCGEVGSLAGGHGHADALSVEVAVHGKTLLVDSGTYTYHESRDMRDHFRSSMAHNSLTIDGLSSSVPGNTFNWKTKAQATLKTWIQEERFDLFEGSHDGYQRLEYPAKHHRSILFIKNDYWIIRDTVETQGDHEYALNFHFASGIKTAICDGGRYVGGDDHRIFTFGDNGDWQQKESWISTNHGNKINAPFMRFVSNGAGTQEFFTVIMPVGLGAEHPEVTEMAIRGGRAFVIKYNGYTDLFVFNDEPGQMIETEIFATDFKYSWVRMSDTDALPDEFILIEGDKLRVDMTDVLDEPVDGYAAVRRLGGEFYINAHSGRRKTQLK